MSAYVIITNMISSFLQNFKKALKKTRSKLTDKICALFGRPVDEQTMEELEEILYEADLGSELVDELMEVVRPMLRSKEVNAKAVLEAMRERANQIMVEAEPIDMSQPHVILMIGVNGSGKTTSCAKLAHRFVRAGKSVLLCAADTFRAAAIDQLASWATRINVPIVKGQPGGDAAATAFDALESAKAKGIDVVIIDTAGRLQSKTDLMRELEKLHRVCHKSVATAPHETILVLDATTGQNGLDQAESFHAIAPLSSIALTKLDGTAKGGIALGIAKRLKIPVRYVGVGEKVDDFDDFDPKVYLDALFQPGS